MGLHISERGRFECNRRLRNAETESWNLKAIDLSCNWTGRGFKLTGNSTFERPLAKMLNRARPGCVELS